MTNPRITVMIPVFNMEETIGRAIESFLSQKYENKELIILDAGSTDGTLDVVNQYRSRIQYVHSGPDEGPSHAMASHIAQVTGDIVGMLGADDWYNENALNQVAEAYVESGADVVYGDCCVVYPDGRVLRKNAQNRRLENLYFHSSILSNAAFVKREHLEDYYKNHWNHHKDEIDVSTDHYLWLLLYHAGRQFYYINSKEALTNYSMTGRSSCKEYEGCRDNEQVLRFVFGKDPMLNRYLPIAEKYFSARTILLYEKVIGTDSLRAELEKYIQKDEKYVIFGTGDVSRKAKRILDICGGDLLYFVDNSLSDKGNIHMGKKVYSPQNLKKEKNVTVVIAALGCEDEIQQQIDRIGVDETVKIVSLPDITIEVQKTFGKEILEEAWKKNLIR